MSRPEAGKRVRGPCTIYKFACQHCNRLRYAGFRVGKVPTLRHDRYQCHTWQPRLSFGKWFARIRRLFRTNSALKLLAVSRPRACDLHLVHRARIAAALRQQRLCEASLPRWGCCNSQPCLDVPFSIVAGRATKVLPLRVNSLGRAWPQWKPANGNRRRICCGSR